LRSVVIAGAVSFVVGSEACGQSAPYDPYAESQDALTQPLAPDGTIHWGTFYKSLSVQRNYERLWNLGACRGTNRAITAPVAENRLVIDRLPEAEFSGVVQAAAGSVAGGTVAIATEGGESRHLVAVFHPAGVTRLAVRGRMPPAALVPGLTVRFGAELDGRGRTTAPVRSIDVIGPQRRPLPAAEPGRHSAVEGTVVRLQRDVLVVQLAEGRIRRVTAALAADAAVSVDAPVFELIAPGDVVEMKGRLWTGAGSLAAGTVFVSDVTVTKSPPPPASSPATSPAMNDVGAN